MLPEELVLVDFDWKNWILTEITGLGQFSPEKILLVDFDRKNWFRLILAGKCDSGRFWVTWGHLGFPNEFIELETVFLGFRGF